MSVTQDRVIDTVKERVQSLVFPGSMILVLCMLPACAKHADFLELREEVGNLSKTQDQLLKRQETLQRRLQALETGRPVEDGAKVSDLSPQRVQELTVRLKDLENRLNRLEDSQSTSAVKPEEPLPPRIGKPAEPDTGPTNVPPLPGTPGISPTSAFNLAYNDYLNGRYELAVSGFQRFLKDFPSTSLAPNAYYWIGESYFSLKDYPRALQAFQKVVNEYPRNEKVPPALFKLGVVAAEAGDLPKARGYFRRVIEEYSSSDEAKLAKNKLAELR